MPCRTREGETDIYFSGLSTHAPQLRMLRTQAGGELYIAVGHEVSSMKGSRPHTLCRPGFAEALADAPRPVEQQMQTTASQEQPACFVL